MPLTRQQANDGGATDLDSISNAGKIGAVSDLLGLDTGETAKPEKAAPDTETETTVSEALAETEKFTDSDESQQTVKPPKTLAELAERLDVNVADLYAIEVPASEDGGESHTLGSLKDEAAKQVDFAGRELEFEERRVKFGNDQAKARQELELVLAALPEGAIKPEMLATARREREVMLDREDARSIDVIPEWKDNDAKRADLVGIGEHMAQYGFDKSHIDQIFDHRMLRYMRDNLNRMKLVERALDKAKPVKKIPRSKTSAPAKPKVVPTATPASTQKEQVSAIDALLTPRT